MTTRTLLAITLAVVATSTAAAQPPIVDSGTMMPPIVNSDTMVPPIVTPDFSTPEIVDPGYPAVSNPTLDAFDQTQASQPPIVEPLFQQPEVTLPPERPVVPASALQPEPELADAPGLTADGDVASSPSDADGVDMSGGGKQHGKGKHAHGHRWRFFGDYLWLRARDFEVAYATPTNTLPGAGPPIAQMGATAVADLDYQPSFRAGFDYSLTDCASIGATYTMYEGGGTDTVTATAPLFLFPSVSHPSIRTVNNIFLNATAQYDISYDMIDVDFTRQFVDTGYWEVAWTLGLRVAQHEQNFQATYSVGGTETVTTDIDFFGIGPKFGLSSEIAINDLWYLYGKTSGSVVPGEFDAAFADNPSFAAPDIATTWSSGRIVSIWDLELGMTRVSRHGGWRFSAGYTFSAWTNMLQTDEWIRGVHDNNMIGMTDTSTLDGLFGRLELRY